MNIFDCFCQVPPYSSLQQFESIMIKRIEAHKQQAVKTAQKPKKNMATLRLQRDIQSYSQQTIKFVQLAFPQQNSLQTINITISPQPESPYHNCKVTFQLVFPDTYPINPPKLKCLNKIYHPNINYEGSVCLPLVREDYEPTVDLTMIICGLIFIMTYPNAEDALNPNIGDLMIKQPKTFQKILDYTVEGRSFENKQYDKIRIKEK